MDFQVAVYGKGRFGHALAEALPAGVLARTGGRATAKAAFLAGLKPGTLVLLAVPDDAMREVASAFAALDGTDGLSFVHPSGVSGAELLKPLADKGAPTGVFHILQSFPPTDGQQRMKGSYAAIAGTPPLLHKLKQLGEAIGVIPFELKDDQRVAYHAAAVLASNALIGLLDSGRELLVQAGMEPDVAGKMLIPLARGTLDNAEAVGVREALTGPVARGDVGTIARHLGALTGEVRRTYVAMMLAVCDTAERAGRTTPEKLAAIRALLAGG
ncbi:MAG: DUF2520 domain-containing protein [Planctomycetes bacterium]|nr:DUF2520 domain-containing protein [Planctomycetota bacterium]